ncbi:TonB-dependent receptor [Novosphingobium sp. Gsoil 351]|uniref:TonB-dependent receptor n=1 Tax=Novosphingobium sp. Gsoil 351 TaxID=2675225 RepID=UPI0018A83961|nr:TonB-dependent receptor [Novosphingobium sp. Gsoil 351]
MNSKRSTLLVVLALGGSALPGMALAQTAPTDSVSGADDELSALGDIVVTARRREENLQDVPIAVTAYTAETLQAKAITDRTSLADNTPSLFTINGGYPREFAFFALRGQGPAFGSTPGVVNYFAEVPNSVNVDGRVGTYYDLANVQVLAGPQGTLFGKNATGGNILFEPMKPQNGNGGYVRAEYGNYNDRRMEGAVNVAIVPDTLLLRVAGEVGRRDGYTKDVGPFFNGKDYDNLAYESFRVGLTVRPTDRIEIYTVGRYYNSHTNGGGTVLGAFNPAAGFDASAFGLGFLPVAFFYPSMLTAVADQAARGPRRVSYNLNQFSDTRYWQIINQATFELSDALKLKNVISYSELKTIYGYDYDATANPLSSQTSQVNPANPGLFKGGRVPTLAPTFFTEELQLQGTAFDKALTFTFGGFLDRQKTKLPAGIAEYTFFPAGTLVPTLSAIFDAENSSEAVFAQATLELGRVAPALEGFSVTGGLRYTWEHSFSSTAIGVPTATTGSVDDDYLSYTATLDYDVSRDVHVYVTARDAYKSGGFNGPVPASSPFRFYPAEKLSDVEIGLKSQFDLGGLAGRFNVAAYRGIYDNIQRTTVETVNLPTGPAQLNVTRSAAKGKVQGLEVNAAIVPVTGLTLTGSYSYIDAKYTKVADASAGAILNGSPFPYTPKHKFSLGASYDLPLGSTGDLRAGINYVHQSKSSTAQTNSSFYRFLPAYGLFNASLDWRNVGGRPLDIGVFVNNLTDETKPVGVLDQYAGSTGTVGLTYSEPRMYGVRVGYRFGS